jgi:3-hydroxyacyl-CoA dehydrogenase/enoyl-CoA hydratase/3-hydroxybutyryl-CoA epimerase
LAERSSAHTILATNTSALSISEIAESVSHPERVMGIHYFNPVHKMQLVELVLGKKTDPKHAQRALKFIQQSGKLPVVVRDSPGFLVNRVLMPYLMEAGRLFEGGAHPKTLDACMVDFGMPMGPIRLIDEVGIDVSEHVSSFFIEQFGNRMPKVDALKALQDAGSLGRKTHKGFYTYGKEKNAEPEVNNAINALIKNSDFGGLSRRQLQERMVALMINEAAMCLEEGVVEAPEDIDFGMIFGTGFAPFRGGPMRYADTWGAKNIVAVLETVEGVKVSKLLQQHADNETTFYT